MKNTGVFRKKRALVNTAHINEKTLNVANIITETYFVKTNMWYMADHIHFLLKNRRFMQNMYNRATTNHKGVCETWAYFWNHCSSLYCSFYISLLYDCMSLHMLDIGLSSKVPMTIQFRKILEILSRTWFWLPFCKAPILFVTGKIHLVSWASYQIRKIAGCACAGNAGNVFPRRRFQRKPLDSDPGMHHGTCVTHVPWCMSGSLACGDGENVPGIPGACALASLRIWQEAHGDQRILHVILRYRELLSSKVYFIQ